MLAYNTMVNRVTGVSPYFALFRQNCQLPLDLVLLLPTKQEYRNPKSKAEFYFHDLHERFYSTYAYILKNQDSYILKEADCPYYTMNHQKVNVGDIVYYFSLHAQPGVL